MDRIDALKLFKLVAETESFTKAADIARLPRSTVSAVIQKLESSHNIQLFYRTTRKVHLTQDGTELLQRCEQLLTEMDEIENLFNRNPDNIVGKLKIDVPSRIASRIIAPALPAFFKQYPRIEFELGATDRAVDLIQEGIDCVLRVGSPVSSSLIAKRIGQFEIINCASPEYLKQHGRPHKPEDLIHHWAVNYVSPTTGKTESWEYVKDKKPFAITMKSKVMVNHADTYTQRGHRCGKFIGYNARIYPKNQTWLKFSLQSRKWTSYTNSSWNIPLGWSRKSCMSFTLKH